MPARSDERSIQLSTRIPKELRRRLKLHCVGTETQIMGLTIAAIRRWLLQVGALAVVVALVGAAAAEGRTCMQRHSGQGAGGWRVIGVAVRGVALKIGYRARRRGGRYVPRQQRSPGSAAER